MVQISTSKALKNDQRCFSYYDVTVKLTYATRWLPTYGEKCVLQGQPLTKFQSVHAWIQMSVFEMG